MFSWRMRISAAVVTASFGSIAPFVASSSHSTIVCLAALAITGEKFERFEASFVGAGDTLSAALAALLSVGSEPHDAVGEALAFLDQSLEAGFRPGMGNVVPDRFFWALPPAEAGAESPSGDGEPGNPESSDPSQGVPRRVH